MRGRNGVCLTSKEDIEAFNTASVTLLKCAISFVLLSEKGLKWCGGGRDYFAVFVSSCPEGDKPQRTRYKIPNSSFCTVSHFVTQAV